VISFCRFSRNRERILVCACNFTPVPRSGYRVGVPRPGYYREILNTDAALYGGGDMGNSGGVSSEPVPWHGQPHSVLLTIPPLAAIWLVPAWARPADERRPPAPAPGPAVSARGDVGRRGRQLRVVQRARHRGGALPLRSARPGQGGAPGPHRAAHRPGLARL